MVLVHGGFPEQGLGSITAKSEGTIITAQVGYAAMLKSGNVLDAIETDISSMEADPSFNCGYGSALNQEGIIEMDAGIMHGTNLEAGCVTGAKNIRHPIQLARRIMQDTPLCPCAMDEYGNVAAGTSTGGLTGKMTDRVGDSVVLGGSTYVDNDAGAVSSTGCGEIIMRYNMASRILANISKEGMAAQEAVEKVLNAMTDRFGNRAGVVCIDKNGSIGIHSTAPLMAWAYQRGAEFHSGIEK